jgi:glycosyltransferase involved in cell wall biosynthesis
MSDTTGLTAVPARNATRSANRGQEAAKRPLNIMWVTDHCCYDGILHAGGRLFYNVIPRFDPTRIRVFPCMMRTSDEVRALFDASPVRVNVFEKGPFDLTAIGTYVQQIKQNKIDVLHLHCYGTSTYGRIASLLTGVPCIIHDYDTDHYFPYTWYLGLADRILTGRTGGAIAASPLVREFMANKRKVDRRLIRLMLHPVLPEKFEPVPAEAVARMRAELEIPAGHKIVGAITKLAPERGNDFLLRAAAEVLKAQPDTTFLFVYSPTEFHRIPRGYSPTTHTIGRSKVRAELQEQAQELGILDRLRFYETIDVPDAIEAACDLIVAPFLNDRFSCARLLEAMAKGKPLVATDMGEQRELVKNGVNGYLVEPGNVRELAEKITDVLADPTARARMGQASLAVAREHGIEEFVARLEEWYSELASRKP